MTTFCTFYSGVLLNESVKIAKEIGKEMNWKLAEEVNGQLVFSSKFNWDTWGQKVIIKYISLNSINITVETKFSQFADSGSGSRLIKEFIEKYQTYVLEKK